MAPRARKWTKGDVDSDDESSESHSVGKLKMKIEESLVINKNEEDDDEEDSDGEVDGSVFGNIRVDEFNSKRGRMFKSEVLPSPGDLPPDESSNEEVEELGVQPNINHSLVFLESEDDGPIYDPSTLVPAVRGTREKKGLVPKERRVSWSPDVYDPVPTDVSYAVKSKQKKQLKSVKKTGKDKQKGYKAAKASSTKDKKQNKKQVQKMLEVRGVKSLQMPISGSLRSYNVTL